MDAEAYEAEAAQVAAAWEQTQPGTKAATIGQDVAEKIIVARAHRVAQTLRNRVAKTIELASNVWAAPIAAAPFGFLASSLPNEEIELPVAEATLIHLAVRSAAIDPATPLDTLLKFREQHKDLAGRLRGSLIDVAATIRADLPIAAVVGQAEAAIKNRVEPALGALETELKRGRISFVWSNVLGMGGVLATGFHPTAATIGGGTQLIGRGIRYVFDRDALVRDHPFGYLHKVRTSFLEKGISALDPVSAPSLAPTIELETLIAKMYVAAFLPDVHHGFAATLIGQRSTDPAACQQYLRGLSSTKHDGPSWWALRSPELVKAPSSEPR